MPGGPVWDFCPISDQVGAVRGKRCALAAGAGCRRDGRRSVRLCVWLRIGNAKIRELQGPRGKLFRRTHKKTLEPSYLNPLRLSSWPVVSSALHLIRAEVFTTKQSLSRA